MWWDPRRPSRVGRGVKEVGIVRVRRVGMRLVVGKRSEAVLALGIVKVGQPPSHDIYIFFFGFMSQKGGALANEFFYVWSQLLGLMLAFGSFSWWWRGWWWWCFWIFFFGQSRWDPNGALCVVAMYAQLKLKVPWMFGSILKEGPRLKWPLTFLVKIILMQWPIFF